MHTTCTRCHRPLRATTSRTAGMGPVCARRTRAEQQYKPAQVDKARDLVNDRGIVDTGIRTQQRRRVFQVVASNGVDTYFATTAACTCLGSLRGKRCYHRLAVAYAA